MKLLITSDVHADLESLKAVIHQHLKITAHLNAGDMCLERRDYERYHIITVKGNNDFRVSNPYERVLEFGDLKVLLVHGHTERVKSGLDRLIAKAKLNQVGLCIFGHTHERFMELIDGIIFLNPGSLGDYHKSYAIYEDGQITFHQR